MSSGKQHDTSGGRSLATARAAWAWAAVERAAGSTKESDQYANEARDLPARLLASGLGQSLAYLYSKRDKRTRAIYADVSLRIATILGKDAVRDDAMELVVHSSAAEYRRLSREVLASAEWLKRFADGRLKTEADQEGEG